MKAKSSKPKSRSTRQSVLIVAAVLIIASVELLKFGAFTPFFVEYDLPTDAESAISHQPAKRPRVLVGIFVTTENLMKVRRNQMRRYFMAVNDDRVCRYSEYKEKHPDECQLVYTFVLGANKFGPTELLDDSRPLLWPGKLENPDQDTTYLNIKENMDEGKSQTWFRYASIFARQNGFDYVVKCDSDSVLHVPRFFDFLDEQLGGAHFRKNKLVYVGSLNEAAFMHYNQAFNHTEIWTIKQSPFFHVYMEGQFYLMSVELAEFVSRGRFDKPWYRGIEDHDIGLRAMQHPRPLHMVPMHDAQKSRVWLHPVKTHRLWEHFIHAAQKGDLDEKFQLP